MKQSASFCLTSTLTIATATATASATTTSFLPVKLPIMQKTSFIKKTLIRNGNNFIPKISNMCVHN